MTDPKQDEYKVSWKGWLSLILLIVSFSGIFTKAAGPWRALDFQVLTGQFGQVAKGVFFTGKGGVGAREGFMFALTLFPTLMFALGCINVAESMGALRAAEKMFRPILRPFMGIPGATGLAFVSSFTSSDVGAVMTKGLAEEKMMTDDERTVFVDINTPVPPWSPIPSAPAPPCYRSACCRSASSSGSFSSSK